MHVPARWLPPSRAAEAAAETGGRTGRARSIAPALLGYALAVALGALLALLVVEQTPAVVRRVQHAYAAQFAPTPRLRSLSGTLLYTVARGEQATVFALPPGAKAQPAATGGGDRTGAIASADGRQLLALVSPCPRCAALYELRDVASGATRTIGSAPPRAPGDLALPDAAFSADGARIAFVETGADSPTPRVFILDQRSGARRPLAPFDARSQAGPVWSPDGRTVAYLSGGEETGVIAVNVATGEARALNDQLDHAADLSWSPDGRYLSLRRDGQLWLIEAKSGHGFQLPLNGVVKAIGGWSPNSRALVVLTGEATVTGAPAETALSVIVASVEGGPAISVQRAVAAVAPRWSPDGKEIARVVGGEDGWTIVSGAPAGAPGRKLASGTGSVALDDWK